MTSKIQIGCEAFIRKDDLVLLGKRKNCYGAGDWALIGGHLEFNEKLVDGLRRELKEEIGVTFPLEDFRLAAVVDDIDTINGKHYIHHSFEVIYRGQEVSIMEPDKCEELRFFSINDLPLNIFVAHKQIVKDYLSRVVYRVL